MIYLFTNIISHTRYHYFLNDNMLIYAVVINKIFDKHGNWKFDTTEYWSTNQYGVLNSIIPPFDYVIPHDLILLNKGTLAGFTEYMKEMTIEQIIFSKI